MKYRVSKNRRASTHPRLLLFVFAAVLFSLACSAIADENLPPEITQHYNRMMIYHLRLDKNVPEGAVLFIGDSITQGLCVAAVCASGVNFGIGSDTTLGVLKRVKQYNSVENAGAVLLAVGINDLKRRSDDDIIENYEAVLAEIPVDTPLIFSAVMPIDERVKGNERNMRVRHINTVMKQRLANRPESVFIDTGSALADSTGNLSPCYHVGDGVHPNEAGYEIWIADIREALEELDVTAAHR
jgi:lysophospholipase L1-like esterase